MSGFLKFRNMKHYTLFFLLSLPLAFINGQVFTEITGTPFEDVASSSIAFADIDGDNDMDVLIAGAPSFATFPSPISKLYTNDGDGVFSEVENTPFEGVFAPSVAFSDIDGDADMDILITGAISPFTPPISKLYTNDGDGVFSEVENTPFEGVASSSIAFTDIDGDADLDVLITGNSISKLYTNDGNGIFTELINTPFEGVSSSSIAFADIDGDFDMDVLITGDTAFSWTAPSMPVSKLYTNDGNGLFTEVAATPFDGVHNSSIAFADIDGDNDLDVLITGDTSDLMQPISKLYKNDGSGIFTEVIDHPFIAVSTSSIAFADVDGDNDMDVLITGKTIAQTQNISTLYTNDGNGTFTEVNDMPFAAVSSSSIAFADVDGDADLDILITGDVSTMQAISKLYKNDIINSDYEQVTETNDVYLFPNPANHELIISNMIAIETLRIYDSSGQVVKQLSVDSKKMTVDVTNLPSGNYILELKGDNNSVTKQFVK
jgi:hypothetical protein